MLMALLLPDPEDADCPKDFIAEVKEILPRHGPMQRWGEPAKTKPDLRKRLLDFIADFANWDNSSNQDYLSAARSLVKAAHGEEPPLVVDPFAGGGSIPLEALRVGCDAFASDLNPVACLINKVMLEDIPRHGPKLADELRRVGKEIKEAAEKELAKFYPPDPDGARPIAYLWARTVRCEAPDCGAEIPLVRSFWLCKKASRKRALRYEVKRTGKDLPEVEFEIFEPEKDRDVPAGTVNRAKATCLCCSIVLSPERVRAQLSEQRGGADVVFDDEGRRVGGARMTAVVTLRPGETGRHYRSPTDGDHQAVLRAMDALREVETAELQDRLSPIPDEPLPPIGTLGFRVQRYGMVKWGHLFSARQKLALTAVNALIAELPDASLQKRLVALSLSRTTARNSALCIWLSHADQETVWTTFGRNALPIVWDFAEAAVLSSSTAGFEDAVEGLSIAVEAAAGIFESPGQAVIGDASESSLPDQSVGVWFTDPPYYDAIPYADLSDFFFVWLKRALPGDDGLLQDPYDDTNPLTPKTREAVQDEAKQVDGQPKDRAFFESAMARAFSEGHRVLSDGGVGSVVFAHKTTEGWEALLTGIIGGGWVITASWPILTERAGRPRVHGSAALATSVHLVCRRRHGDAGVGDWGDVLRELPKRVRDWMKRLQSEGIRGADLVFACIGPALEIFSRYPKVETADGREVTLAEYLERVWEVVGRTALEQILAGGDASGPADTGALEEDARLAALFLWTLQSTRSGTNGPSGDSEDGEDDDQPRKAKGYSLIFDVARRFAQPLGIQLPDWEGRIIETTKGVVRLLSIQERAKQLFGLQGASAVADDLESGRGGVQLSLFPEDQPVPEVRGRRHRSRSPSVADGDLTTSREATTLDRVHAAMLLQSGGRSHALRALLQSEMDRGPDFLRLSNALAALYPIGSEERRLVEAMLLAVPK